MQGYNLKNLIVDTITVLKDFRYHSIHKNNALAALKNIENEKGKTDPKNLTQCFEYANDVFGDKKYANWLYVYAAVSESFKEGWIPDNFYGRVIVPKLKGEYGKIDDRNLITNQLLSPENSLDICYCINGQFWDVENNYISVQQLTSLVFKHSEKVVFKKENSNQGRGVFFFSKNNLDLEKIIKLGDGVFQSYINQHRFFSDFTERSVATIRLTTVTEKGKANVRAAYLRLGQGEDTHIRSSSALKIPVEPLTGKLDKLAYYANWTRTDKHPDHQVEFSGLNIPHFRLCVDTVLALHNKIPYVASVGWDLIVDCENKVRLIEWNGQHNGIKFSEAVQGPCFKNLGWSCLV